MKKIEIQRLSRPTGLGQYERGPAIERVKRLMDDLLTSISALVDNNNVLVDQLPAAFDEILHEVERAKCMSLNNLNDATELMRKRSGRLEDRIARLERPLIVRVWRKITGGGRKKRETKT